MQDYRDLIQADWDGNVVWKSNEYEVIDDPGEEPQWMARVQDGVYGFGIWCDPERIGAKKTPPPSKAEENGALP